MSDDMLGRAVIMHAHQVERNGLIYYHHIGSLQYVRAHMCNYPIVRLSVTPIDQNEQAFVDLKERQKLVVPSADTPAEWACYWGWISNPRFYGFDADKYKQPSLLYLYPSVNLIDVCFAEGVTEAEKRGKGRLVGVVLTKITEEQ